MTKSTFYHAFEAAFRGSRAEILERLRSYAPFLEALSKQNLPRGVLDLGCGRGEWLETLEEFGFDARGVDLDKGMLSDCISAGLPAEEQDALEALAATENESLCILSAFHLIEHLPFDEIRTIVNEGLRVLAPGGLLVLETPNPENIEVGTVTFYNDSTHIAPIPPNVLKFLAEHAGYARIKLLRLNAQFSDSAISLEDVLFRTSPDYALVAQKAGNGALMEATEGAFLEPTNLSTRELVRRFDAEQRIFVKELKAQFAALQENYADLHRRLEDLLQQSDQKIENQNATISVLNNQISRLKKTKKTRLYYRSKKIEKYHKKIIRWFIERREDRRAKAARVQHGNISVDRSGHWKRVKLPRRPRWRLEGPFDSSYSLAIVNRELARALARQGADVTLKSSEGPGDFDPNREFLAANPDLAAMQAINRIQADTVSRNMYPPRVADIKSALPGLHSYAWEETGFPREYTTDFNNVLRYLTVTSDHVRKVMIDNGVFVPTYAVGNGVDHFDRIASEPVPDLPHAGRRFLHISSCFPRKGADVLLAAWAKAFTADDDVALIIKSFPNPHNDIAQQVAALQADHPKLAPIHLIDRELSNGQMRTLCEACDVAVFPSRAEGFGLPLAEALLLGKPVLTTGWSGQMVFADLPLVHQIDYRFAESESHVGAGLSMWADPNPHHLAELMRNMASSSPPSEKDRIRTRELLLSRFSWDRVAERSLSALRHAACRPEPVPPRIGWVTTYNTRCGIATYSEHLIRYLRLPVHVLAAHTDAPIVPDSDLELRVTRCWEEGREDDLGNLLSAIRAENLQTIVIQFNYGFFAFPRLASLINALKDDGRQVLVTLHSTNDTPHPSDIRLASIKDALGRCDRLLVHTVADANRLKNLGFVDSVALFPHGVLPAAESPAPCKLASDACFTVGSYGFFLPNKGLSELVDAINILHSEGRNVRLRMINAEYPVAESRTLIEKVEKQIKQNGLADLVDITTEFLSDEAALAKLSDCDLIVFGYQQSSESASGAVRYGLVSGRPVAVTPLEIFSDVKPYTIQLPGISASQIARGIADVIDRMRDTAEPALDAKMVSMLEQARDHIARRSYAVLGPQLKGMIIALWDDLQNGIH
ncbi:glycosyltransferase [Marivita sp. GX14005]|uniref:glycosyltransferase n=1 Tax=Marivita sp. GX14005 TaxID=2942276 RepID=UPI002018C869|nr:glycosyltransferase [Marivita sp. GX14005]MCL3883927.1 glycosyltransferase [Marivita sp. GX14005]